MNPLFEGGDITFRKGLHKSFKTLEEIVFYQHITDILQVIKLNCSARNIIP